MRNISSYVSLVTPLISCLIRSKSRISLENKQQFIDFSYIGNVRPDKCICHYTFSIFIDFFSIFNIWKIDVSKLLYL